MIAIVLSTFLLILINGSLLVEFSHENHHKQVRVHVNSGLTQDLALSQQVIGSNCKPFRKQVHVHSGILPIPQPGPEAFACKLLLVMGFTFNNDTDILRNVCIKSKSESSVLKKFLSIFNEWNLKFLKYYGMRTNIMQFIFIMYYTHSFDFCQKTWWSYVCQIYRNNTVILLHYMI